MSLLNLHFYCSSSFYCIFYAKSIENICIGNIEFRLSFISFSFSLSYQPPFCIIFTTKRLLPFCIFLNMYPFGWWYCSFIQFYDSNFLPPWFDAIWKCLYNFLYYAKTYLLYPILQKSFSISVSILVLST